MLASPLYADLRGLPPLLLHASASAFAALRSLARLAARASEAGVEARVALWADAPHCWQLAAALMPQVRELIRLTGGGVFTGEGGRGASGRMNPAVDAHRLRKAARYLPENKRGDLAGFLSLPASASLVS